MERPLILYADDDPDDLEYLKDAFEQYAQNAELLLFKDGIDLLFYLDKHSQTRLPSLIIIDINMPLLNGYDALKIIRQTREYHHIPVVLFSTMSKPFDEEFGKRYKAGFLSKPSNEKQMTEVIGKLMEQAEVSK